MGSTVHLVLHKAHGRRCWGMLLVHTQTRRALHEAPPLGRGLGAEASSRRANSVMRTPMPKGRGTAMIASGAAEAAP